MFRAVLLYAVTTYAKAVLYQRYIDNVLLKGGEKLKNTMSLTFDVTISNLVTLNHSFSKGTVQIAYHGRNRNKSDISKETFEKALPSLKNIPIVGRYIPEDDDFGSHDMTIVQNTEGQAEFINVTVPFGVVPEGARQYWSIETEEDGTEHEYLYTECIFWTRQYGYSAIAKKQKCHQSMEVAINEYHTDKDGYCVITDMEWEALCILGDNVEPCFESASVQLYSQNASSFQKQFSQMIQEIKECDELKTLYYTDDEGGNENMPTPDNTQIVEPEVPVVEPITDPADDGNAALDPATEPVNVEPEVDPAVEPEVEPTVDAQSNTDFSLDKSTYNADKFYVVYALSHEDIRSQIYTCLYEGATDDTYFYVDAVFDKYFDYVAETYTESGYTTQLYRQEYEIEDEFVKCKGDKTKLYVEKMTEEEKNVLDGLRTVNEALNKEVMELKTFKAEVEETQIRAKKDEILAKWSIAIGVDSDAFKSIQASADTYSLEELEKELKIAYADVKANFALESTPVKSNGFTNVKIAATNYETTGAYGGLFEKYGYKA